MEKINILLYKVSKDTENFGEYMCERIINSIGFKCDRFWRPPDFSRIGNKKINIITGIGGLLNKWVYKKIGNRMNKWYVWGSGVDCIPKEKDKLSSEFIKNRCIINMVRGPLTRDYYNLEKDILLGDPGYLVSKYFIFPEEEKRNVFIQFYHDKIPREIKDADVNLTSLLKKDKNNSYESDFITILKNISNAKIVLTGSMHIVVAAHSYGVPFAMVSKEHRDLTSEWKWHDTLGNIGLSPEDIQLCNTAEEGLSWWHSIEHKLKKITPEYQEEILNAFPYKQ